MKKIIIGLIFWVLSIAIHAQNIDTVYLKNVLNNLASIKFEGRYPGTNGGNLASNFILKQFKKSKLNVSLNNGFQPFEFINSVEPNIANHLQIGNYKPLYDKDFITFPYSISDTIAAPLVFAGYGIEFRNDSIQWNDYNGIDVTGKCVLLLRGDPDYEKSTSVFANSGRDRNKVMLAKEKGAIAVILVSPHFFEPNDEFRLQKNYQGDAGIPVIQIKRRVADSLFKYVSTSISEIENNFKNKKTSSSINIPVTINMITGLNIKKSIARNVLAVLPGSDPILKNEFIVVGAHYDHLGWGGNGSSSTRPDTVAIHFGADDNASGITAIIGIANVLTKKNKPLKRSIMFMAYDAEEEGVIGSKYFVNNPLIPLNNINIMFNFDMVGRMRADKTLQIAGTGTFAEADSLLKLHLSKYQFKTTFDPGGLGPSDYASFYSKNIPVLSFTTGIHPDYHTPFDIAEKLNFGGVAEIVQLSADLITTLANSEKKVTYKQVTSPSENRNIRRGKVSLGIMPDFSGAEKNGLRIDGVTKGKPADKAGLKKDDIITAINGAPVKDIYEYMFQMGKYNVGDKIVLEIMRNGEKKNIEVDL